MPRAEEVSYTIHQFFKMAADKTTVSNMKKKYSKRKFMALDS